MRSQHKTQRPFAMSPTGAGNDWPMLDMDAWLAETVLDEGFVCQVSWREQKRMTWQVANFSSTQKGVEYARSLMDDSTRSLFDLLVHTNQPAGPCSPRMRGLKEITARRCTRSFVFPAYAGIEGTTHLTHRWC